LFVSKLYTCTQFYFDWKCNYILKGKNYILLKLRLLLNYASYTAISNSYWAFFLRENKYFQTILCFRKYKHPFMINLCVCACTNTYMHEKIILPTVLVFKNLTDQSLILSSLILSWQQLGISFMPCSRWHLLC